MRGQNKTGQAQDGTMGMGLFDANDQPGLALGNDATQESQDSASDNQAQKGAETPLRPIENRVPPKATELYSIPDLPTVSVKVEDWGTLPDSPNARYMILKGRAIRWYRGLIGTTIKSSDGKMVSFNKTGRKKLESDAGENLLEASRAIPKIIMRGTLLSSGEGDGKGVREVHRYAANVRVGDGVRAMVVTVRETPEGNFHYSTHNWMDGAPDASAVTERDSGKAAITHALEGDAADDANLSPFGEKSNNTAAATGPDLEALHGQLEKYGIAHKVVVKIVDSLNGAAGSYGERLIQIARDK